MYFIKQSSGKGINSLFQIMLFLSFPFFIKAQKSIKEFNTVDSGFLSIPNKGFYNNVSIFLSSSVLPKANIHTKEGDYHLNSKLSSNFGVGINYTIRNGATLAFQSGIHFNVLVNNYYLLIPDSDLGGYISTNGFPQIDINDAYARLTLPVRIIHDLYKNDRYVWNVNGGINIHYNGFLVDRGISVSLADSNYQYTRIFSSEFDGANKGKPWLSYVLSSSVAFNLKNKDQIRVLLIADLSTTNFLKGEYQITIPNKPVTLGTYSITGSSLGLSVEYVFTGYNRRYARRLIAK
jgi:hypothetical protein